LAVVPLRNASLVTVPLPGEPRLIVDVREHWYAVIDGVVRDEHECTAWEDDDGSPPHVLGVYLPGRSECGGPNFDSYFGHDDFDPYFDRDEDDLDLAFNTKPSLKSAKGRVPQQNSDNTERKPR
jgi:hypothetical protein